MSVTSLYPVLMTADVPSTARFYREVLGCETTFESDWYVSLRLGAFELAVLDRAHATVPEGHREAARGVLVNVEVEDVDGVFDRLTTVLGHSALFAPRDEAFGQRHFIAEAPDGVLLDVITPIQPTEEFAASFTG